jgi:hypothetical protein
VTLARSGVRDVLTNWPRYTLVALSMLVGVVGVVAVSLAGSVASDLLVAQQEQLNGRDATYSAPVASALDPQGHLGLLRATRSRIGPRDIAVALEKSTTMQVQTPEERAANLPATALRIVWFDGEPNDIRRLPMVTGSRPRDSIYPLTLAVNAAAARVIRHTSGASVFVSTAGQTGAAEFTVVGTVADGVDQPIAYGNLAALAAFFPSELAGQDVTIDVTGPALDLTGAKQLLETSAAYANVSLAGDVQQVDTVASVRSELSFFQVVFAWVAVVLLGVAALGIANVGIASVSERSREFVIRRALGARRRDVFGQVMAASVLVGAAVAVVAIALAVVAVYIVVPALIPSGSALVAPTFPLSASALAIIAAVITGVVGGAVPALRATRIPVAEALRE